MTREFVGFGSIERMNQSITITEKIHGSNAQIVVDGADILAGSRTRWITPDDDNYNFAKWVHGNREALIALLGDGSHFGEWYGSGINAGYGLKDRRFALFNTHRWKGLSESPEHKALGIDVVPVLYTGPYTATAIDDTFAALKAGGSVLVPGYDKPEGIVVRFDKSGTLMKKTYESEDESWTYRKERPPEPDRAVVMEACAPFWQPVRLEKLLSRDERYGLGYPKTLPDLCRDYLADVFTDHPADEDVQKLVRRNAFSALKRMMAERGFTA